LVGSVLGNAQSGLPKSKLMFLSWAI